MDYLTTVETLQPGIAVALSCSLKYDLRNSNDKRLGEVQDSRDNPAGIYDVFSRLVLLKKEQSVSNMTYSV